MGHSGIVFNPDKFRFAHRSIDFTGFRIYSEAIEPLPMYLEALQNFQTQIIHVPQAFTVGLVSWTRFLTRPDVVTS